MAPRINTPSKLHLIEDLIRDQSTARPQMAEAAEGSEQEKYIYIRWKVRLFDIYFIAM
jgi:hypothetical protein